MMKDEIPRGQLSTIILMTLQEKDKYGYEIIDEVLNTTNGKVSIKQPSLYSSLKRMEEQSLISSYWRDSDIGGKRHYYHLTDLGKKHLEKWKNDLPVEYVNNNNEESHTRVLQQENLFNLGVDNKKEIDNKTVLAEPTKNDSFVQFDLFSSSTIVTPPDVEQNQIENFTSQVNDEQNSNETSQPTQQSPILTSYEKPIEQKQYTFNYVKRTNKSFADCLREENSNYEKKYTQEKTFTDENIEHKNTNLSDENSNSVNFSLEKELSETQNFDENQTAEKISLSNLKNYVSAKAENQIDNTYEKELLFEQSESTENSNSVLLQNEDDESKQDIPTKDDGVFITERLNIEDMPKPTKWDTKRFDIYAENAKSLQNFKIQNNNDNDDKVQDLYQQSKNFKSANIDDKVYFSSYTALQEFYKEQNISFKPFNKSLKKKEKDYSMIKSSKLNMLSALSVFIYAFIVSICFAVIFSFIPNVKLNHPLTYIFCCTIFAVYFLYFLIVYIKTPQKKVAQDSSGFKLNIKIALISILLLPLIFAVNMLFGFSFSNFLSYGITILYPSFLALSYFVYYISKKIILRTKSVH